MEEGLGVADGGADRAGDLPVLPDFALRLHGTAHAHLAAVHAEGRVALEVEGGGQHDVHVVMRFVTVEVVGGKREVDLPDGLLILFGRGPDEGVHAEARERDDGAHERGGHARDRLHDGIDVAVAGEEPPLPRPMAPSTSQGVRCPRKRNWALKPLLGRASRA